MDSIENGASKIICIPVVPGRDGTVSVIEPSVTEESGSVSVTGKPNNAFEIVVVITGMIRRIHVHGKTNSCDLTSLWGKLL